jgi:hypothetical protein
VKYPEVVFDFNVVKPGIAIQEMSRRQIEGETVIKFSVSVDNPEGAVFCARELTLILMDSTIPPLSIPVHCYYDKKISSLCRDFCFVFWQSGERPVKKCSNEIKQQ